MRRWAPASSPTAGTWSTARGTGRRVVTTRRGPFWAVANDAPIQRFWRDAHAGRVHAANDPERAYVIFGNHEFGLPPGDTMV
ncbi:hypothetical protein [Mycobacterium sp. HUMS_1102779]